VAPYKTFYNQNVFVRTGEFFTINTDYTHSFKDKSKLSLLVIYEYSVLGGLLRNQDNDEGNGTLLVQERSDERSDLNGWRLQTDYSIPIKNKSKIELGYQWRCVHHQGDFNYERLNITNGSWEKDRVFYDNFDLKPYSIPGSTKYFLITLVCEANI